MHGLAVALLYNPASIRYVTGTDVMSVWTASTFAHYCVVAQEGTPLLFEYPASVHVSQRIHGDVRALAGEGVRIADVNSAAPDARVIKTRDERGSNVECRDSSRQPPTPGHRMHRNSVPVRQWVLTLPHGLRAKIAFDPGLTTVVLREFIAAVSSWLRKRTRRLGIRGPLKTGAVTVIQRFNSAIELSAHLHALVLDGLYTFPPGAKPVFHPTPSPTDEDIAHVAAAVFRRVERKLADREPSPGQRRFAESAALLLALGEASAQGIVAAGPRRGCRVIRIRGAPADVDAYVMGRLCAQVEGYNVQAATRIAANDEGGLERMARYLARPPIATDRLSLRDDGRLELRLKRRWRDGTTAFVFHPEELIARLVALVPRPNAHLVRYSGVLAPAFFLRSKIVPAASDETAKKKRAPAPEAEMPEGAARVPWAPLLWRVLGLDVLKCDRCSGRMRIIAAVTSRVEVARILESMGLPTDAPSFHAARPPPQEEMSFEGTAPAFEPDRPAPSDA